MSSRKLVKNSVFCLVFIACTNAQASAPDVSVPTVTNARVQLNTCAEPNYPKEWYEAGEKGTVAVALLISDQGRVLDTKLVYSSGFLRLDKAAKEAFAQCKFDPGSHDGIATEMWTEVKFTYRAEH